MKKATIILFAFVFVATLIAVVGISNDSLTTANAETDPNPTSTPSQRYTETEPMPEELAYWVFFQETQSLKAKDTELHTQGTMTDFKTSFYMNRLGLDSAQVSSVDAVAADFVTALAPIDQRARDVINQYRSQYPNGELKKVQPAPTPDRFDGSRPQQTIESLPQAPAELTQLQAQKTQLILNYKDRIRNALGQAKFADFDGAVKANATKILLPINPNSKEMPKLP